MYIVCNGGDSLVQALDTSETRLKVTPVYTQDKEGGGGGRRRRREEEEGGGGGKRRREEEGGGGARYFSFCMHNYILCNTIRIIEIKDILDKLFGMIGFHTLSPTNKVPM